MTNDLSQHIPTCVFPGNHHHNYCAEMHAPKQAPVRTVPRCSSCCQPMLPQCGC